MYSKFHFRQFNRLKFGIGEGLTTEDTEGTEREVGQGRD